MPKKQKIVLGVLLFSIFSLISGILAVSHESEVSITENLKSDKIVMLRIEGPIVGGASGGLISDAGSDSLLEQIHNIGENKDIKAVLLRINSPGGSAAASEEIYQELKKVKKSGKKIVVSMGDTCASGGYMIACAADKIVAIPSTMTGSIGVIMDLQNTEEMMKKLGIKSNTIKSGEFKDIGNSQRKMTPEEKKILQEMVDNSYQQFVDIVAENRKIPREKVLQIADGRIYTGEQAQKLGLVDKLGNLYDAIDLTRELAGLPKDTKVTDITEKSAWDYFN